MDQRPRRIRSSRVARAVGFFLLIWSFPDYAIASGYVSTWTEMKILMIPLLAALIKVVLAGSLWGYAELRQHVLKLLAVISLDTVIGVFFGAVLVTKSPLPASVFLIFIGLWWLTTIVPNLWVVRFKQDIASRTLPWPLAALYAAALGLAFPGAFAIFFGTDVAYLW